MNSSQRFAKAIVKAMSLTASQLLEAHRSEYREILKSKLLGTPEPTTLGKEFSPRESHVRKISFGWAEIDTSFLALKDIPRHLSHPSHRPASVSSVRFLQYHFENWLQEVYVLQQRLNRFLTTIERAYRKDDIYKKHLASIHILAQAVNKSFEGIVNIRGGHVRSERFQDSDLKRLRTLELLAKFGKSPFPGIFRGALRRILKQKRDTIRINNRAIQKALDVYFDALDPILFDRSRKLRFPPGVLQR